MDSSLFDEVKRGGFSAQEQESSLSDISPSVQDRGDSLLLSRNSLYPTFHLQYHLRFSPKVMPKALLRMDRGARLFPVRSKAKGFASHGEEELEWLRE